MTNAAILEKIEQLPAHVQEEVTDFVEFLHQKYVSDVEEELKLTSDGDAVIGYDMKGNPKLASVVKEQYRTDLEAVERGVFISFEDFEKESAEWLKSTK